jgi:hypothetical protein
VRAYPKGAFGFKLSIIPPGGKADWSGALDAADREAIASQQARLEAASRRPAALGKAAGRAKRAAFKAARTSANRNRESLRSLKKDTQNNLVTDKDSSKRRIGWSINEGCEFDASVIIADREFSREEFEALKETWSRIQEAASGIDDLVGFVQDFTPSVVQPTGGLSFKFFNGELQGGAAYYPVSKGARFQAVEHELFVAVDIVLLGAEGAIGLIVGRRILGTGADATVLVTLGGSAGFKGECTFFDGAKPSLKANGELKFMASGAFVASVAYREIVSASIEVTVAAKVTSDFRFETLDFGDINWELPPIMFVGNYRNTWSGRAETRRVELTGKREGVLAYAG